MALQGDLNSFALPDVLRLLAGTGKSGRLEVSGPIGVGEVLLRKGAISSAKVSTSPHAAGPADVVFDMLRFDGGSFAFDEGDVADKGVNADVESTIDAAESLVEEWTEIEAVVPSMDAWISLVPELEGDEITVSADHWKALAAIGGGGDVHDLASALELTDLMASRRVMEMVQSQLVAVRPSPGYSAPQGYEPPQVQLDDFEEFEVPVIDPMADFEELVDEERHVVMEDRDDALLPEPLPGEGVAYEGEPLTGVVDGRTFDTIDSIDTPDAPVDAPAADETDGFEAFESLASFEEEAAMAKFIGEPGGMEGFGDADPFSPSGDEADFADATSDADQDAEPEAETASVMEMAGSTEPTVVDDERDSLLKFLSSVKP